MPVGHLPAEGMRVLVTGAAGKVGRAVLALLGTEHRVVALDLVAPQQTGVEVVLGSVEDWDHVHTVMEGADAVVHLAYAQFRRPPEPAKVFDRRSMDVNVWGTYNVMHAAKEHAVRRVVHVSTLSVYDGIRWDTGQRIAETCPVRPGSVYGLTKFLGEQVVRYFAEAHGVSSVVLRLSGVTDPGETVYPAPMRTSTRDVARAVQAALHLPRARYEVFHICGDNPGRPWDIERARRILGFEPQDRFEA